jgi:thymidylate synthase
LELRARRSDDDPTEIRSGGLGSQRRLAAATNRTPHDLIISFGDLHIYRNHLNQVEEQLSRTPRSLPVLSIRAGKEPTNPLARLMRYEYEDLELMKYDPYPKITAPVAV